jgi:hypothetical protein
VINGKMRLLLVGFLSAKRKEISYFAAGYSCAYS